MPSAPIYNFNTQRSRVMRMLSSLVRKTGNHPRINDNRIKVCVVFGTRPEVIKLAPIIRELKAHPDIFNPILVHSGQHKKLTKGILPIFGISEDEITYNLNVMKTGRLLEQTLGETISKLGAEVLDKEKPDMVIIQGDTYTTLAAKIAADYHQIPVAYVEAGLRTYNMFYPFPEEIHRQRATAGHAMTLYFAPSERARQNLLEEGVPESNIRVTGNTGIDALKIAEKQAGDIEYLNLPKDKKIIVLTCHRREAIAWGMKVIFGAVKAMAQKYKDQVHIVFPVHLNPAVRKNAQQILSGVSNIQLVEPLNYLDMISLMKKSYLIVTDSGGIQEEAPELGKPVVVIRNTTERQEVIDAGNAVLTGISDAKAMIAQIEILLNNPIIYNRMSRVNHVYGKGNASKEIVDAIFDYFDVHPLSEIHAVKQHGKVINSLRNAVDWMSSSGIQEDSGAVNGFYDCESNEFPFAYPEIAGYAISTFLKLYKASNDDKAFLNKAKKAANWLIETALTPIEEGIAAPARLYYKKDHVYMSHHKLVYGYDNGIIMNALVNLYNETGEIKYLKASFQIADFLIETLKFGTDNAFVAYDPETKKPVNPGTGWSMVYGAYLTKVAHAFIVLYKTNEDKKYLQAALKLCDDALQFQKKDGRFVTSPLGDETHAHPHCYAAEGLLFTGIFLKEKGIEDEKADKYIKAAINATQWLLSNQTRRGEIRHLYYKDTGFLPNERVDALAQALYLAVKLYSMGLLSGEDRQLIDTLATHLMGYQVKKEEQTLLLNTGSAEGGFKFGTDDFGKQPDHVNSWCTMFSLRALAEYKSLLEFEKKGKPQ